jgi:aspartate racemase
LLLSMSRHIGIVACSAEGAALCYRTICKEASSAMGRHRHPEVSMHTHCLADYMDCTYRNDWQGVADRMLSSAHKLAGDGADFLICPDNTIHRAFDLVTPRSPLPWLHIVEEVARVAQERNIHKLAVTGTKYTMEGPVYPQKLAAQGIGCLMPEIDERARIDQIIMDELANGIFTPESRAYFQQVIARMKDAGCDAVVLGCTEIPLIVEDASSPLPTLDSTPDSGARRDPQGIGIVRNSPGKLLDIRLDQDYRLAGAFDFSGRMSGGPFLRSFCRATRSPAGGPARPGC